MLTLCRNVLQMHCSLEDKILFVEPIDGQNMPIDGQNMPTGGQNMPIDGQNMPIDGQNMPIDGQNMNLLDLLTGTTIMLLLDFVIY